MPGRIIVEIERDGELVPVTKVARGDAPHETGVVLDNETSASPRGLGIHIRPLSARAKKDFSDVQERHRWVKPRTYRLNVGRAGPRLVFAGVDDDSLPAGKYELKIRIGGMKVKPSFPVVQVPKDGDVKLRLKEKAKRRLRLTRKVGEFDKNPLAIIRHPDSRLDGMSAENWLTRAKRRDRRKAVLLNVLAKLESIPVAREDEAISRHIEHVFFAEIDRIYCAVKPNFLTMVDGLFDRDSVIHSTHKRLLTRIPEGSPEDYDLISYREPVRIGSLQAVVAVPKRGKPHKHYVDLDIDGANPGMDLVTFFIHFGEILNPDATNHLKLMKKLDHRQLGDFLYYEVVT